MKEATGEGKADQEQCEVLVIYVALQWHDDKILVSAGLLLFVRHTAILLVAPGASDTDPTAVFSRYTEEREVSPAHGVCSRAVNALCDRGSCPVSVGNCKAARPTGCHPNKDPSNVMRPPVLMFTMVFLFIWSQNRSSSASVRLFFSRQPVSKPSKMAALCIAATL